MRTLSDELQTMLPPSLAFDHPTPRRLAGSIASTMAGATHTRSVPHQMRSRLDCSQGAELECALNCDTNPMLPARAWMEQMAACSYNAVGEVPAMRWDAHSYASAEVRKQLGQAPPELFQRTRHGGFVGDLQHFDHTAFRISAAEAASSDPHQRALLEVGYTALHSVHLQRASLDGSLTGVFVGILAGDFASALWSTPVGGRRVHTVTAATPSIASGRVSYVLGLHGPCVSYDTACSASLTACHAALRAHQLHECYTGLVMGANFMFTATLAFVLGAAGMSSVRGRCHTFDSRADGYVRGEACGACVLRHQPDGAALRLLGSAVRQDGRSASLTAPNGQAQQQLLNAALADASTLSRTLARHESHGTGTALGDPIESGSLSAALHLRDAAAHALSLGGVKANAGHGEASAGMSALLALARGLKASVCVCNTQLRAINEHVLHVLDANAFHLPVQFGALQLDTRAGGVSSFGFSGTIAHAVMRHAATPPSAPVIRLPPRAYKRRVFLWREPSHPFVQSLLPSDGDDTAHFRSPVDGALHRITADHVVAGRAIFPGAGYLELARAATRFASAIAGAQTALHGIYFLRPLLLETLAGWCVDCIVASDRFEVRSDVMGDEDTLGGRAGPTDMAEATLHCSGVFSSAPQNGDSRRAQMSVQHALLCAHPINVAAFYDVLYGAGLQYGPGYRTLTQASHVSGAAAGWLHSRYVQQGTLVHPADLDDALCLSGLAMIDEPRASETRLPFSVDDALLQGVQPGRLAVCLSLCIFSPCTALLCGLTTQMDVRYGCLRRWRPGGNPPRPSW